jgi:hypothetical protein
MIGVKVYEIDGDVRRLFAQWSALGIDTVFAGVALLGDEFMALARDHGIEVFAIVPVFFDPGALHANPDLHALTDDGNVAVEEWVEFVCPSREDYRRQKIDHIVDLVGRLQPDGLSLDFIRHFVFWEKVYPDRDPGSIPSACFDPHCLRKFQADTGISIPNSLSDASGAAAWIQIHCREEWAAWRCDLIATMVRDAARQVRKASPKAKINLHAVPWRQEDFGNAIRTVAGQDLAAMSAYADTVSPMTYAHMLKRDPTWIRSVVQDMADQTGCGVIPSIQVNQAYLPEPLTASEFDQSIVEAMRPPSAGLILWSWEQLDASPVKKEALSSRLAALP